MNLLLVLTYHWYDEIAAGRKRVEYRTMSPHWRRLIWERRHELKTVTFRRGYTNTSLCRRITHIDTGACPYDGWDGEYYLIHFELEATPCD